MIQILNRYVNFPLSDLGEAGGGMHCGVPIREWGGVAPAFWADVGASVCKFHRLINMVRNPVDADH